MKSSILTSGFLSKKLDVWTQKVAALAAELAAQQEELHRL